MNDDTHKADDSLVSDISTMSDDELDGAAGGEPNIKGYHFCWFGVKPGGGPGLYPDYLACYVPKQPAQPK